MELHGLSRFANCDRVASDGKNSEFSAICYTHAGRASVFIMDNERMICFVLIASNE
jgi:hypothetical protein